MGDRYHDAQNFSQRCVRALDKSLVIDASGIITLSLHSYINPPMNILDLTSIIVGPSNELSPCNTTHSSGPQDSPEVHVPYLWCASAVRQIKDESHALDAAVN